MVASEAEGRAEALRRIAACRAARADELDLGGLQLTALDDEILKPLCELTWLRRLFLGGNADVRKSPRMTDFGLYISYRRGCNALGALPGALFDALVQLVELDLAFAELRGLPASIAKLTALSELDLHLDHIGLEGARALKGLTTLTSLELSNNSIGPDGAQAVKGLAALTHLNLSHNQIGDEGAQVLKGLVGLTSLGLSGNEIGDEGAQAVTDLSALTSLDLSHNRIGPDGAQALKGLVALTSLHLSHNTIGDKGAEALKGLASLTNLYLSDNNIGP
jgi:Leucine-rich repeat (LRR) protein